MTISQKEFDKINPRRSLLFVPAARLEMLSKALNSAADVVCIDLEDSVADDNKDSARTEAISVISNTNNNNTKHSKEIWIRINSIRSTTGLEDVVALTKSGFPPDGIMMPKISSPEEVRILRDIIIEKHPDLILHTLIETTDGLKKAYEIAKSSHKVGSIIFGGFDMAANLRIDPNWSGLLFAREQLVLAAANSKIDLLDTPHFELDDLAGLKEEALNALEIGFTGKCAIHPKQIDIINEVFSPSAQEIERARDLIAKYESQKKAFVEIDGVLMEKPVVQRLYRTLAIAERIST